MNIVLTPEFERYVQEKVASGAFRDPSAVIIEGLRLLHEQELAEREALAHLKKTIDERMDDTSEDDFVECTPELFEDIKRRGMARLTEQRKVKG